MHLVLNSEWRISRHFGEVSNTLFNAPIDQKKAELLALVARADPKRTNLFVIHPALRTPVMEVLFDRNNAAQNGATGDPLVARHREGELRAVLSPEFGALVKPGRVKLVTYDQVIARAGGPRGNRPLPQASVRVSARRA